MQDTDQRWISYGFVFLHIRIIYSYLLKHQALCHETERITELPYILEWSVKRGTITVSIAEKCFDIWGILKMVSVKSVESGNKCFSVNHIIRCRSKFLPLGFSKFVLVLIL